MARIWEQRDYFICRNCGAEVITGKTFCRECGASDESGWGDNDEHFLPPTYDDDFDYDEYVAREFPDRAKHVRPTPWTSYVVGIIIVLLILAILFGAVLY